MKKQRRALDRDEHRLTISIPTPDDPTLVVCPQCCAQAKVLPDSAGIAMRLICTHCSYADSTSQDALIFYWNSNPTDGYFGCELWLSLPCCGKLLWAFNRRHLNFLQEYVSADLRERRYGDNGWRNASLASRLPAWIKSSKNRKKILHALKKLNERL